MRTLKIAKQGDKVRCVNGQKEEGVLQGEHYYVSLINGDVVWLKDSKQRERFIGRERFSKAFMLTLDERAKI